MRNPAPFLLFPIRRHRGITRAFTLPEVVLALGITAFCTLTLIGLFTLGLDTNLQANRETRAATIAQSLLVTRRASPTQDLTSLQPHFPLPPITAANANTSKSMLLDNNGLVTTDLATAQFGFTYVITAETDRPGTNLHVILYWPAQAAVAQASGRYELVSYFPPL